MYSIRDYYHNYVYIGTLRIKAEFLDGECTLGKPLLPLHRVDSLPIHSHV